MCLEIIVSCISEDTECDFSLYQFSSVFESCYLEVEMKKILIECLMNITLTFMVAYK